MLHTPPDEVTDAAGEMRIRDRRGAAYCAPYRQLFSPANAGTCTQGPVPSWNTVAAGTRLNTGAIRSRARSV